MITFKQTCESCPEQYDAYEDGKVVGYVRLRHGHFSVRCPDAGGEVVYESDYGDAFTGAFADDGDRQRFMARARYAIRRHAHPHNHAALVALVDAARHVVRSAGADGEAIEALADALEAL